MDGKQSFWDHLDELRAGLLRVAAVLLVSTIGLFAFMPRLFDQLILAPTREDFLLYRLLASWTGEGTIFGSKPFAIELINIHVASQFTTHISTSFYTALIATCPYLLYELWRFIRPALYEHERGAIRTAFGCGTALFFVGCVVGYLVIFPLTFRFLAQYSLSEAIATQIALQSYMNNFLGIILTMGLAFELPLVVWLLARMGLISRSQLKQGRRYVVVALLIAAALITPSGDPFSLAVVFTPLYLLYELGIAFTPKN